MSKQCANIGTGVYHKHRIKISMVYQKRASCGHQKHVSCFSNKGKKSLLHDSYIYRIDNTLKDKSILWRCCNKKYKGRLKTESDDNNHTSHYGSQPRQQSYQSLWITTMTTIYQSLWITTMTTIIPVTMDHNHDNNHTSHYGSQPRQQSYQSLWITTTTTIIPVTMDHNHDNNLPVTMDHNHDNNHTSHYGSQPRQQSTSHYGSQP